MKLSGKEARELIYTAQWRAAPDLSFYTGVPVQGRDIVVIVCPSRLATFHVDRQQFWSERVGTDRDTLCDALRTAVASLPEKVPA